MAKALVVGIQPVSQTNMLTNCAGVISYSRFNNLSWPMSLQSVKMDESAVEDVGGSVNVSEQIDPNSDLGRDAMSTSSSGSPMLLPNNR